MRLEYCFKGQWSGIVINRLFFRTIEEMEQSFKYWSIEQRREMYNLVALLS